MVVVKGKTIMKLDDIKKILKEMENYLTALREMQAKVKKEIFQVQDYATTTIKPSQ